MDEVAAVALQTRMADLCGHLNVLHAQLVASVVEALDGDLWMQWGIKSPEHWLAWQTGLSPTRAKQMVDTARRAAELPATFAAFADGELSVDQVATVAKHAKAHNDAEVCEIAKSATVTQLRNALARYVHTDRRVADQPVPVAVEGGDPRDYVSTNFDDHGRFALHLSAPADRGAIISKALAEARDALIHAGQKDVTWLDAFVEVCNRSLDSITSRSRRDRFRIYMHLNTDDPDGPAGAWLNGGPTLPDAIRDVLCCDGVVQPLWHTGGLPVNVGRARYIVPPHTRRCVLDRDRTCRHPSCSSTTFLEVHHIVDWLKGGRTDMCNLVALCPKHHDAYHRGEYRMSGNPDIPGQLRFYDARGRPIPNAAVANLPTGPPPAPPPGKRYAHPTGERFDTRWLNFTAAPV
jgi:Domain of unknown function (DUF222)/HNH endonuclease